MGENYTILMALHIPLGCKGKIKVSGDKEDSISITTQIPYVNFKRKSKQNSHIVT